MPSKSFCNLVDDICKMTGIADPRSLYFSTDLEIDFIKFTCAENYEKLDQELILYCDFGALPPANLRTQALQRLLELNLSMPGASPNAYSINEESQHVLLIIRLSMQGLTAKKLLNDMAGYAAKAKNWRKTYYLASQQPEPTTKRQASYQQRIMDQTAPTQRERAA